MCKIENEKNHSPTPKGSARECSRQNWSSKYLTNSWQRLPSFRHGNTELNNCKATRSLSTECEFCSGWSEGPCSFLLHQKSQVKTDFEKLLEKVDKLLHLTPVRSWSLWWDAKTDQTIPLDALDYGKINSIHSMKDDHWLWSDEVTMLHLGEEYRLRQV